MTHARVRLEDGGEGEELGVCRLEVVRAKDRAPRLLIYPEGAETRCVVLNRITMSEGPPRPVMLGKEEGRMVTVRAQMIGESDTPRQGAGDYYRAGL